MSPRFISNMALGLAGAIVVVASQTFTSSVTGWVTFGVALGAVALFVLRATHVKRAATDARPSA